MTGQPISGKVIQPPQPAQQSGPGEPSEAVKRPPGGIMLAGWLVILLGLVGFTLWASFAPLDAGVTAPGTIVVDTQRQRVQHLSGGIVAEILVRDGDPVEQGQVLVRLDRTTPQAELAIVRAKLLSALALEARLRAERDAAETVDFPAEVLAEQHDPRVELTVATQRHLFETRRRSRLNEVAILEEQSQGIREQIQGHEAQIISKQRQASLLQQELDAMQHLFEEGYVPRTRIFELERALAETEARLSDDIAAIGRARSALGEVRLSKVRVEQEFLKQVETELSAVQREVDELHERRVALTDQLDRVDIRAPVSGVVVNRQVHTIGGVVRPGEDLLELVPGDAPLIIEARVAIQSIELLWPGQEAMVRFSALDTRNPVVHGEVVMVSADRLEDQRTGEPYFLARVEVPVEEMDRLTYERIVPGMPVDVVVRTQERTLLQYLLKPVTDALFTGMRER